MPTFQAISADEAAKLGLPSDPTAPVQAKTTAVSAADAAKLGLPPDPTAPQVAAPPVSAGTSALEGFRNGATFDFAPQIDGAVQGIYNVATDPNKRFTSDLGNEYRRERDLSKADRTRAKTDNPLTYTGSNLGGNIASAVTGTKALGLLGKGAAAAEALPEAVTEGQRAAQFLRSAKPVASGALNAASGFAKAGLGAMGYGAVNGLANSNADLTQGDVGGNLHDAAEGAVDPTNILAGLGLHGAAAAGSAALEKVAPSAMGLARKFAVRAFNPAKRDLGKLIAADAVPEVGQHILDKGLLGDGLKTGDLEAMKDKAFAEAAKNGQGIGDALHKFDALAGPYADPNPIQGSPLPAQQPLPKTAEEVEARLKQYHDESAAEQAKVEAEANTPERLAMRENTLRAEGPIPTEQHARDPQGNILESYKIPDEPHAHALSAADDQASADVTKAMREGRHAEIPAIIAKHEAETAGLREAAKREQALLEIAHAETTAKNTTEADEFHQGLRDTRAQNAVKQQIMLESPEGDQTSPARTIRPPAKPGMPPPAPDVVDARQQRILAARGPTMPAPVPTPTQPPVPGPIQGPQIAAVQPPVQGPAGVNPAFRGMDSNAIRSDMQGRLQQYADNRALNSRVPLLEREIKKVPSNESFVKSNEVKAAYNRQADYDPRAAIKEKNQGEVYKDAAGAINREMERKAEALDPELAGKWQKDKHEYGINANLAGIGEHAQTMMAKNRKLTMSDMQVGQAGSLRDGDKGGFLNGVKDALLHKFVRERGNAVMAKAIHMGVPWVQGMSEKLARNPAALGVFGAKLNEAFQSDGPQGAAATNFVLSQSSPHYQDTVQNAGDAADDSDEDDEN